MSTRDAALFYLARGWVPVRVEHQDKKPIGEGWQNYRPGKLDVKNWPTPFNVGVLLGAASGWLCDVDLDSDEAVALAPHYLPPTWVFGRASRPRSHWLYRCEGAYSYSFAPNTLELRGETSTGSGHQTVMPPSTHKSGEAIVWDPEIGDHMEAPLEISYNELVAAWAKLARGVVFMQDDGDSLETAMAKVAAYRRPEKKPEPKRITRVASGADVFERARSYIDRIPGAISGQRGHDQTFNVALALIRGFGLTDADARTLMHEYSRRCDPPWSDRQIEHKIQSARATHSPSAPPFGYLLERKQA